MSTKPKIKPRPRENHSNKKLQFAISDTATETIPTSKKIVLQYFWYYEVEPFYNQLKYFTDLDYEIYLILIGHINYDFSNKFQPRVFNGPFFGPYGEWFNFIKEENIIYDYDYVSAYVQLYKKLNLPLDRFKNKDNYTEYIEKLKIFGYLDYVDMEKVYKAR